MDTLTDTFIYEDRRSAQERLKKLAKELKTAACDLRRAEFPLHGGLDDIRFPAELREKARYLHEELSALLLKGSSDGIPRGCPVRRTPSAVGHNRPDWRSQEMYNRVETLLAGDTFSFARYKEMCAYDTTRCNAVWPTNNVAYRCNTCAKNPCMSLCVECFTHANHENHDFSRFFSQAGGACDCGNDDVLDPRGFCTRHGSDHQELGPTPVELTAVAEFLFVKLFVRLLNSLRSWRKRLNAFTAAEHKLTAGRSPIAYVSEYICGEAEPIIQFIQHFLDLGGPIVELVSDLLLSRQLYAALNETSDAGVTESLSQHAHFKEDRESLEPLHCRTYYLLLNLAKCEEERKESSTPQTQMSEIGGNEQRQKGRSPSFPSPSSAPSPTLAAPSKEIVSMELDRNSSKEEEEEVEVLSKLPKETEDHQEAEMVCECLLDELLFYLTRLYFPQTLINLLLSLLSNNKYKERFSCRYFENYTFIAGSISQLLESGNLVGDEGPELTNKIIHVSVQICTSLNVCLMLEKVAAVERTLDTMNRVLYSSLGLTELDHSPNSFYAREYTSTVSGGRSLPVVDITGNKFITSQSYWYIMTDLQDLFVHAAISANMWKEAETRRRYVLCIASLQGVDTAWRIVEGNHSEHDSSNAISRAFTLEWECSTTIMLNTLNAGVMEMLDPNTMAKVVDALLRRINAFFSSIRLDNYSDPYQCPPFCVTFHLPLHRHLAYGIQQMLSVHKSGMAIPAINIGEQTLRRLLLHPMRIQAVRAEYYAQMWVRNGYTMAGSVFFYDRPAFNQGFYGPDLALIRFIAANVDPNFFLEVAAHSFHLPECFSLIEEGEKKEERGHAAVSRKVISQSSWIPFMFDGYLRLIIDIVALKMGTGYSAERELRAELVALLSFGSHPHSRLKNCLPERGSHVQNRYGDIFDRTLGEISHFQEPDQGENIKQGVYTLKDEVWKRELDVNLCRNRCSTAKEFNMFVALAEEKEKLAHIKSAPAMAEAASDAHYWLGYRLLDFDNDTETFEQLKPAWFIIAHPTLFHTIQQILRWLVITRNSHPFLLQQLIYLLSLSVKLICSNYFANCVPKQTAEMLVEESRLGGNPDEDAEEHAQRLCTIKQKLLKCFTEGIETQSLLDLLISLYRKTFDDENKGASAGGALAMLRAKHLCHTCTQDRIFGTPTDYIGRLLCQLYTSDYSIGGALDRLLNRLEQGEARTKLAHIDLGPGHVDATLAKKKAESKRKQAVILQAEKVKQARLMQVMMAREGIGLEELSKMEATKGAVHLYECPICNDTSANIPTDLVGVMVMLQCDAVVDTAVDAETTGLSLVEAGKRMKEKRQHLGATRPKRITRRAWTRLKDLLLLQGYNEESICTTRLASGVGISSCGHYAHLDCFTAFVETLNEAEAGEIQREEKNTYQCPVCRQPVNAILPLWPTTGLERPTMIAPSDDIHAVLVKNTEFIEKTLFFRQKANAESMCDTYKNYAAEFEKVCRRIAIHKDETRSSLSQDELFTSLRAKGQSLLQGVLQNGIEKYVLLSQSTASAQQASSSKHQAGTLTMAHLIYAASVLEEDGSNKELSGAFDEFQRLTAKKEGQSNSRRVPILLYCSKKLLTKLCVALLADDILVKSDKLALCKLIYHYMLVHAVCSTIVRLLFRSASSQQITEPHTGEECKDSSFNGFCSRIVEVVRGWMKGFSESPAGEGTFNRQFLVKAEWVATDLTLYFSQLMCDTVKFDKQPWGRQDFDSLYCSLRLALTDSGDPKDTLHAFTVFCEGAMGSWLAELNEALVQFHSPTPSSTTEGSIATILLNEPVIWDTPCLLPLPNTYDELFNAFFGLPCDRCGTVPSNPMICLSCGQLSCLDDCCELVIPGLKFRNEVERHSIDCGSGYGCFLSLNASMMIVIQDRSTAHIWGSVYLDSYGEEDRNLRRGKPLFLSAQRWSRFQQTWLTHSFTQKAHSGLRLPRLPIRNLLPLLRDIHQYP